jgi:hypothetical protein
MNELICLSCNTLYKLKIRDIVIKYSNQDLYFADLFTCPVCDHTIAINTSDYPCAYAHHNNHYTRKIKQFKEGGILIETPEDLKRILKYTEEEELQVREDIVESLEAIK